MSKIIILWVKVLYLFSCVSIVDWPFLSVQSTLLSLLNMLATEYFEIILIVSGIANVLGANISSFYEVKFTKNSACRVVLVLY